MDNTDDLVIARQGLLSQGTLHLTLPHQHQNWGCKRSREGTGRTADTNILKKYSRPHDATFNNQSQQNKEGRMGCP